MIDTQPKRNPITTLPYTPMLATVTKIITETWDTKTFRAVFNDEELRESFTYEPGQFQEVSVFGVGECTFCLTSSPTRKGYIEFSVKKVGSVTTALHEMSEGETVGIRGAAGQLLPVRRLEGQESAVCRRRDRNGADAGAAQLLPG